MGQPLIPAYPPLPSIRTTMPDGGSLPACLQWIHHHQPHYRSAPLFYGHLPSGRHSYVKCHPAGCVRKATPKTVTIHGRWHSRNHGSESMPTIGAPSIVVASPCQHIITNPSLKICFSSPFCACDSHVTRYLRAVFLFCDKSLALSRDLVFTTITS